MIPNYIWAFIKTWEGGDTITNDKLDTGGLTRWGISQVNNPDINVAELDEEKAEYIFETRYWYAAYCHRVPEYMQLVLMNCAVNCGARAAKRILQSTLGVKVDGMVGKQTLAAADNYNKGYKTFISWYLTHQALYYFNIVQRRKSQHKWLKGWIRRTISAALETAEHISKR